VKVRKKFREEKKIDQQKRKADDDLKGRYGLPASLNLLEDNAKAREEAKSAWEEAKQLHQAQQTAKRRRIGGINVPSTSISRAATGSSASSKASSSVDTLRARILENTARKGSSAQSRLAKPSLPIRRL
jgi:coiled-coil domain-containing protein 130